MRKKGFTLVELLAVIVILAVIALIGTPIILNVIEKSKKEAFKISTYSVIETAELYTILNTEDLKENGEIIFECNGTSCKNSNGSKLDIKGEIPKTGRVIVTKNNISVDLLSDGEYYASGTKENLEIEKDYKKLDKTEAIIDDTKLTITSTSSKVTVNIAEDFAIDKESGIKEYKIILIDLDKKEEKKLSNIGKVEFTGLTNNKEYKVKVIAVNGNDMETGTSEKTITTKNIDAPTCSVTPTGWAQSKSVTCTYESGYTNEYSLDGGSTWKTYTSAVTFTSNGTLIARVTDGTNYISSSSYTVSGVDATAPTSASFTYTKTSKSITVVASGTDSESGIIRYAFSKDNGSTWTSVQEGNSYTFNNLTSGTYKVKVRVYNGTYVNGTSGNYKDSDSQDVTPTSISTPTCSVTPTGWAQSKSVTCTYDSGYTNEYSLDGGSTWKTYTSAITFTSNGTLIARITDGTNYISSSSYTISQIDTTAPSVSVTLRNGSTSGSLYSSGTWTNQSVYFILTGSDSESGIDHYEFSHDGSSWSRGHENWSYSANSDKTTASFAITWDGSWNFYFRAVNGAGKASSSTSMVNLSRDTTAPSLTLGTASSSSKSITVPITASDAQSGIKSTTCVYGTTTSYGSTGTISGNNCVMSNLKYGTTYYYKIVTTNNAGTSSTATGSKATPPAYICKRATTLHTETCTSTVCSEAGYTTGGTITYGNLGTKGTLISGDAFDCDVNGDGTYDANTERFYYVSDLDSETAVLIYYNNVTGGEPNNTTTYAYNSSNVNNKGPVTAVKQLPTTTQWSKVSLKNTSRQITNQAGTTSTSDGEISTFDYTGYAARLLTAQEVNTACGITVGSYKRGELDNCNYLMENTKYSNNSLTYGYWLETPRSSYSSTVWLLDGDYRTVNFDYANFTSGYGVRPAIEVLKSEISY